MGTIRNQAMKRKLEKGEDCDYCVGSTEQWIWSIGRRLSDGAIFAALDARFYGNPEFHCLWLR